MPYRIPSRWRTIVCAAGGLPCLLPDPWALHARIAACQDILGYS